MLGAFSEGAVKAREPVPQWGNNRSRRGEGASSRMIMEAKQCGEGISAQMGEEASFGELLWLLGPCIG